MLQIAAFYKFCPLPETALSERRAAVEAFCAVREVRGLFLLGTEGVNATMCGTDAAIAELIAFLEANPKIGTLAVKYSTADESVFDRLRVEIRAEIVSLGRRDVVPTPDEAADASHLSPQEWHDYLTGGNDYVLLDTRNDYETAIGAFPGAVHPDTESFADFPAWVQGATLPKDKPVLMYCTGGVRCEKAALIMRGAGYANVFQLNGGILNYLEAFPDGKFAGECFVFDRRVAVDRNLRPTTLYTVCPLCGDPASTVITCEQCGDPGTVCAGCAGSPGLRVCSQNCRYHFAIRTHPRQYRHKK